MLRFRQPSALLKTNIFSSVHLNVNKSIKIMVATSVICVNALEARKKWNEQLTWTLKWKD